MAWNMPQFLEIHIIKKLLLVQLYGCTRSSFNITECGGVLIQKTYLEIFWPIQMQMQAPMTEMIKDVMLPVA